MKSVKIVFCVFLLSICMFLNKTFAATDVADNTCPQGLIKGLGLEEEFGTGATELTRCLEKTNNVKVVFNVHRECRDSSDPCTKPYALGNIKTSIQDFEITHGMTRTDYHIVAIVYGSGHKLILKGNPWEQDIIDLINKGVDFFLCQFAARSNNIKVQDMIEGVKFVTHCNTSIADFQDLGYSVITTDHK